MSARPTSIEAYRTHAAKPRQIAKVYEFIKRYPRCTRRQIAKGTGYDVSAVAGRVNELLTVEAIEECGRVTCPVTGKTVMALRVMPVQAELLLEAA